MATAILSLGIIGLSVAGLALGILAGRAPLRGSCGGLGCGGACRACRRKSGD